MKKLFLLLCMCILGTSVYAQNEHLYNPRNLPVNLYDEVLNMDFYGVDFSEVRTIGANVGTSEFVTAFVEINRLFETKPNEYNVPKYFNKKNVAMHINNMCILQEKITGDIGTLNASFNLDFNKLNSMVYAYDAKYKYEIGAVIIAEKLNISYGIAKYYVIYFDNESKDIIAIYPIKVDVTGFGVLNLWSKSVLEVLDEIEDKVEDDND